MKFQQRFTVNAPLDTVAAFHGDTRALRRLTMPPVIVQFNNVEPLGEGSVADFTLWMGPLPVNWVAKHTDFDPHTGFVDTQVKGPFKSWVHRHTFRPIDETTTEVIDSIDAELKPHPFWGPLGLFMWANLPIMFTYRKFQTRRFTQGSKSNDLAESTS